LAALWHSKFLAPKISVELWRMWSSDGFSMDAELGIRDFSCHPKFGWIGKFLPRLARKVYLESAIATALLDDPPKIVHLQNPSPAVEFGKIARLCQKNGIKVVASTHGFQEMFDPQYGWKIGLSGPLHRAFKNVDAFLLGFPEQKSLLASKGVPEEKLFLVPNGIEPFYTEPPSDSEVSDLLRKLHLDRHSPLLLFMGNHTVNKGIGTLMRLAECLSTPATIVVGGKLLEGEPQKWLGSISCAPGVKIVFTDFLSKAEQRVLYHESTLFVFPSISETLPLAVLEAMGAGLPVVAFDTGGVSFELANHSGVVVPIDDFDGFLAGIEKLLADPDARELCSRNSIQRQREFFSWDELASKTMDVYRQLVVPQSQNRSSCEP
jgi:alpha-maltose-1-phosphate synthase